MFSGLLGELRDVERGVPSHWDELRGLGVQLVGFRFLDALDWHQALLRSKGDGLDCTDTRRVQAVRIPGGNDKCDKAAERGRFKLLFPLTSLTYVLKMRQPFFPFILRTFRRLLRHFAKTTSMPRSAACLRGRS